MLIPCVECGREVSDRASVCPQCGCPVRQAKVETERTNKAHKKTQVVGVLWGVAGGLVFVVGMATRADVVWLLVSGVMLVVGLVVNGAGRLEAWWHNG